MAEPLVVILMFLGLGIVGGAFRYAMQLHAISSKRDSTGRRNIRQFFDRDELALLSVLGVAAAMLVTFLRAASNNFYGDVVAILACAIFHEEAWLAFHSFVDLSKKTVEAAFASSRGNPPSETPNTTDLNSKLDVIDRHSPKS